MSLPHFCIERPIFASVIWIIVSILGTIGYLTLPVEQYPEIAPPSVMVTASYPGASAEVVANTVAAPIEQEVNGVEDMLYMSSQSTNDGQMSLRITFKLGTDLDNAQVLVQNRVDAALPRVPEEVRRRGVITEKSSPNLMMVINMYADDPSMDQGFIGNYAQIRVMDILARIKGIGELTLVGSSDYSMRLWLDPEKMAAHNMTTDDVLSALQAQNLQVAAGNLGQQPVDKPVTFEINVQTKGRLETVEEFENTIVKTGDLGQIVYLRDIGRAELGLDSYTTLSYLGDKKSAAILVYQLPGTNALDTSNAVKAKMRELAEGFPTGLNYDIVYNPTDFVEQSVDAVKQTFVEAVVLVILVILLFLQSWRAAIIPILAIPLSLLGTFVVMQALGISLNNLSLFAMILAIGIVVDDAIIVVENVERLLDEGLSTKDATKQTMDEVASALVATSLVLVAVFLPVAFITGISGQFFNQFAIVIAVSTVFSTAVSLTLSPALAALLLKKTDLHADGKTPGFFPNPFSWFFYKFNLFMDRLSRQYGRTVGKVTRLSFVMVLIYAGFMGLSALGFKTVPTGFIPPQDQGYFIAAIQLPPGASLDRTDALSKNITARFIEIDGVRDAVVLVGLSGATFTNAPNAAAIFPVLEDFDYRLKKGITYDALLAQMRAAVQDVTAGFVVVIPPPPVRGIGDGGGFKMMLQDQSGLGFDAVIEATRAMMQAGNASDAATSVFSFVENSTPQLYLNIDRERVLQLDVPYERIAEALGMHLGSNYINDFNLLGRTYRVTAQADAPFRLSQDDIDRIRVRSNNGALIPLGTLMTFEDRTGPSRMPRYNLYPAAELQGDAAEGYSTGQALSIMEELARQILPPGMGFEWTELAFQQKLSGDTGTMAFILAVVFVFLLLAAQYESWVLPLAIILIVPMCLFAAITGVWLASMDNNILTQIGLVVLVGLASKNAILIVEFAKEREEIRREDIYTAVTKASQTRLRPILMTAFSFILGVLPLVIAEGAGAEMRQALGVAVFSGMLGVTIFGLLFTPVFYVLCRRMGRFLQRRVMGQAI